MSDFPAAVVASWPAPNYINPEEHGPAIVVLNAVLIALCFVIVAMRIWTRLFITHWFGMDDWFIIVALVTAVPMNVLDNIGALDYGWNRHIWDVPPEWISKSLQLTWIVELLYIASSYSTVLSFLAFYHRLNVEAGIVWFRWVNWTTICFAVLICAIWIFGTLFTCWPIHALWTFPVDPNRKCLNQAIFTTIGAIIKCAIDLIVTTMPIALVRNISIPTRQKVGVIFLFALGYCITAAGVVRTYYGWTVLFVSFDTYSLYPAYLAGSVEAHIAIIIASIPPAKPLLERGLYGILALCGVVKRRGPGSSAASLTRDHMRQESATVESKRRTMEEEIV